MATKTNTPSKGAGKSAAGFRAPKKGAAGTAPPPALDLNSEPLGLVASLLNGDKQVARLYEIIRTRDPAHLEAWLRMGEAVADGEDFDGAERRFRDEIGPDAVIMAICHAHYRVLDALDEHGSGKDDCPYWLAYEASRNAIDAAKPETMSGLLAKAHAARREALNIDGKTYTWEGTRGGTWAWDLLNDLLRLYEGPELLSSPDADLIRLCGAYVEAVASYNAYDGPRSDDGGNPHEDALAELEDRLEGMKAFTHAGIAAKARVALAIGTQPNGYFCPTAAGDWLHQVARDAVRLSGGAA